MTLQEFIQELVSLDLSTHPVSEDIFIAGNEDKICKVVSSIQNALNDLYIIKMPMMITSVSLVLEEGIDSYPLPSQSARILSVKDEKGRLVPINDSNRKDSVFTPQANILYAPSRKAGDVLTLSCQSLPPKLDPEELDAPVPFPDWLKEAVRHFVTGQIYGSLRTQEGNEASQLAKSFYVMAVAELTRSGYHSVEGLPSMNTFERKGWV